MACAKIPSRKPDCLGCIKFSALLLLGLLAFSLFLVSVAGVTYTQFIFSSERVLPYDATVSLSEYNGKLIRLHVNEIIADGQGAADSLFGIENKGIAVCRKFHGSNQSHPRVCYHTVHGVRESAFVAPVLRSGDFVLKLNPSVFLHGDFQLLPLSRQDYRMPESLKPYVLECSDSTVVLQTEEEPAPTVKMSLYYVPSPLKGDFYLVGRVVGNVLDITEPGCGFIRGEEAMDNMQHRFSDPVLSDKRAIRGCAITLTLLALVFVLIFAILGKPFWRSLLVSVLLATSLSMLGASLFTFTCHVLQVGFFVYAPLMLPWIEIVLAAVGLTCSIYLIRKSKTGGNN